jgi:hypothetical protein
LINYQGGFVRRGLLGEVVFHLSGMLPCNPGIIVGWIQAVLYAVFFTFTYLILFHQRDLKRYWLLIFSPFLFCFQIVTIGGGGRKEILFFALLSILVWVANQCSEKVFKTAFIILLFLYPLVILTHETLAVFLPYFLILFFLKIPFCKRDIVWLIPLLSCSAGAALLAILNPGTEAGAATILSALEFRGYRVDGGALAWLGMPLHESMTRVRAASRAGHFLSIYGTVCLLVVLGFLPLSPKIKQLFCRREPLFLFCMAAAGSFLLAAVAIDWGRWIYINAAALFLLSLVRLPDDTSVRPWKVSWMCLLVMSMIYFSLWHIPSYGESRPMGINPLRMLEHIQGDHLMECL